MKMYIALPHLVPTTALTSSVINILRVCCRYKPEAYKLKYTPEFLIEKQREHREVFGVFIDKRRATNVARNGLEKYKRTTDLDELGSVLEGTGEYVLERNAGLLLAVDGTYDVNSHFFNVNRVNLAHLVSIYPDVAQRFEFPLEKLNSRLRRIHINHIVGDQLIDFINHNDNESIRELLQYPLFEDSLNIIHYQMKFPEHFERDYPGIFHRFRNNSIFLQCSISHVVDKENTNEHAPLLFQAIINQNPSMVDLLLQHGASTEISCNGYNPHQLAKALGNSHIESILDGSGHACSSSKA